MQLVNDRTAYLGDRRTLARLSWEYGSVIIIGAVAMAATYPGRTHGLGMVTEPLLRDLGLDDPDGRVFFASLNLWGTLVGALFCLPVGWLMDRLDRRVVLAFNLLFLGAAVLWMSRVENWTELLAGLILTRGFGQSALSVVSITIVAKSFSARQLGLAMALYAILSAPFHLLLIKAVGWALTDLQANWRSVWALVGVAVIGLAAFAFFLPAKAPQGDGPLHPGDLPVAGVSLWQALATPAFWVFSLTISLWGMIYAGVALFNVDIFRERGFDERLYFNVLALVAAIALAAKLFFGWLVNHVPMNRLLACCLLATALSLAGLPFASAVWHAYAYGVGLGIASGSVALLFFASWGKMYGQRDLGRIQGVAQMMTVFASASGPMLISVGKRATTTYSFTFQVLAGLTVLLAIAAWFTSVPRFHPTTEQTI